MRENLKRFLLKSFEKIIIAIGLVCLFIILYKTTGFYYGINDDISMQKLASGNSGLGVADGHLIFIRYALGIVLATIFRISPSIDWYGLFMVGCIFFCGYIILRRVFRKTRENKNKMIYRVVSIVLIVF